MSRLTRWLDAKLYPDHRDNWDDELFRQRILSHLHGRKLEILDVGAGAGIVSQMDFRGHAARICGIDPDPRVVANPYLDEGRVGVGEHIPYPDASFDLIFADNVLEHLAQPEQVFGELFRLLRPGGIFLAKTPNRSHYMPLVARLTPHRFHQWLNRRRGRAAKDTFPTVYRANTPSALHELARAVGLRVQRIELVEGRPEYLRASVPSYLLGWLYERLVNRFALLARFRILLIVELRKP